MLQLLWKYKVFITTTMNMQVPLFKHCSSQVSVWLECHVYLSGFANISVTKASWL